MNVFILCTGRCGSAAIIKACHEIKNFSADHESLSKETGEARLAYPEIILKLIIAFHGFWAALTILMETRLTIFI